MARLAGLSKSGRRTPSATTAYAWRRAFATAIASLFISLQPPPAVSQTAVKPIATRASASGNAFASQFTLDLTASLTAEVYTLAAPYRVVIDLPGASLNLAPGQRAAGLIKSYRAERRNEPGARLVLDTTGPVEIIDAAWIDASDETTGSKTTGTKARLLVSLKPMDQTAFGNGTGGSLAPTAPPFAQPTAANAAIIDLVKSALFDDTVAQSSSPPPAPSAAAPNAKPVIMIDPGHGGIDPGAIGPDKVTEKNIVLAVASQTKAALDATGRYDVRLTRSTDVFIPLDSRVALSRQAKADVFISLHADTIDDRQLARSVRGASVYTLSDKASNEDARLMAEKENAADLIAGIQPRHGETNDDVKPILFDLMARETAIFSKLLSRSVIASLRKNHPMTHEPERAAAFRVLRQPHAPSVLIELGFLSNPDEGQLMAKPAWQKQVGTAIAAAIDTYFSRKGSTMATAPFDGDFGGLPP